jgi:hypothetical protein
MDATGKILRAAKVAGEPDALMGFSRQCVDLGVNRGSKRRSEAIVGSSSVVWM